MSLKKLCNQSLFSDRCRHQLLAPLPSQRVSFDETSISSNRVSPAASRRHEDNYEDNDNDCDDKIAHNQGDARSNDSAQKRYGREQQQKQVRNLRKNKVVIKASSLDETRCGRTSRGGCEYQPSSLDSVMFFLIHISHILGFVWNVIDGGTQYHIIFSYVGLISIYSKTSQ